MVEAELITVELVYIKPGRQTILTMDVPKGSNIEQAIKSSGLLQQFPEVDLAINKVGIFSKIQALNTVLSAGDRIEVYRPLVADPKEARRRRASNQ